jgi:CheY-like chemotaxis protein
VLRVCVISEMNRRVELAVKDLGWTAKEAQKHIRKEDEAASLWTQHVLKADPWDAEIYDILIPTNKVQTDEAVQLVVRNARSGAVLKTKDSELAAIDFALAALVEGELGKAGHEVVVTARNGKVTLSINRHTLMLSNLEEELKRLAKRVKGVQEVETKVGPGFYQAGVYRQVDVELPSRVLLVDDEREFVQTLSERLSIRDLGSVAVYDGEQALSFVEEEEPEVIVLDLRMPGIDGIEVLRRIKADHPDIEVIILTGHGSEKDQEVCMELGAFAYLQKPVDIEKLSETMKAAYQKVKERRT